MAPKDLIDINIDLSFTVKKNIRMCITKLFHIFTDSLSLASIVTFLTEMSRSLLIDQ